MITELRQRTLYRMMAQELNRPVYVAALNQMEALDKLRDVHANVRPDHCTIEYVDDVLT